MLVSILIPVYNNRRYVGAAIDSASRRDEPLEVVVIDDGSSDGSLEVAQSTRAIRACGDRPFPQPGLPATRNEAVESAAGEITPI